MIPNMMADWDGDTDPQSPTIVLDIRFPFPNNLNVEAASPEGQRSSGDLSFHLSIRIPTSAGLTPTVQLPPLGLPSVDIQTQNAQNAQQLEITLRERLQQQRNNLYQRVRRTEPSKLPTPPSTSQSERLSPVDGTEHSATGETRDIIVRDGEDRHDAQRHPKAELRTVLMKAPEKSVGDKTRLARNANVQPTPSSYTKRSRYSRSPSKSRSRSPASARRQAVQRGREHRSRSRCFSPVRSPRRDRSCSPVPRRSRSVDTEASRGRMMDSKRLQRSPPQSFSSRDSSRSMQSRSLSHGGDSCRRGRARSTSTSIHSDQLAVERASPMRNSHSPHPVNVHRPLTPSTSNTRSDRMAQESSRRGTATSLQQRISGENETPGRVLSKQTRRRTCPFYHPTDKDRHPLDGPHPGYSVAEFEEAVDLYERSGILPSRLIKGGVMVNPKNRQMHSIRSPAKPKFASGAQACISQLPQERSFSNRVVRSRSPNESPAKRRKFTVESSYQARGAFNEETRVYSSYPSQTTAAFRNRATFRPDGPSASSYQGKGRSNHYPSTRFGGNPSPGEQPRPAYGRQPATPRPDMVNYRWQ